MDFLRRCPGHPASLGILPGSFNPPTVAHLTLAEAALERVDEVILVLPRIFPHKDYSDADFAQRAAMLRAAVSTNPRLSAGASDGGLFLEIALECRAAYGEGTDLALVCGKDAAERIVNWNYPEPLMLDTMFRMSRLLVASRQGDFKTPAHLNHRIGSIHLAGGPTSISASDVRRRIRDGLPWEHLVPDAIVPMVRRIYLPRE